MTQPAFTNRSPTSVKQQPVEIQSVDLINLRAVAATRSSTVVPVDLRYYVGAIHVIPCPGDQWLVRWYGNSWVLDTQLPYNTTELQSLADNPVLGMTQVGNTNPNGAGPLELNGSTVNVKAPLLLEAAATTSRPAAPPPGALIYDTTLQQVIFSDGTSWNPITSEAGGGSSYATVIAEVPTGTKDGTNISFTVGHNFRTGTTALYRNGLRERLGVGYTEASANSLSFSTAPLVDDEILVDYVLQ